MFKKLPKILMFLILAVFLVAGSAMAFPYIEVTGWVKPDNASITDQGDGTSLIDVEYLFRVDYAAPGAKMNFISLEFESDVFPDGAPTPTSLSPSDWTPSSSSSPGSFYGEATAGTALGQGEYFTVDLDDLKIYTLALWHAAYDLDGDGINESGWSEGGIWQQSWLAYDTLGGEDGGSTSPIPEPATMLLLGSGLIGLAAVGGKKLFKKS